MDRRKFLRGSGVVAGALGGLVLGYREYVNKPIVDKRVLDQVDGGSNCITISQGYYPKPKPPVEPMEFGENFDISKLRIVFDDNCSIGGINEDYSLISKISFKPGPDGNLYIKVKDEWKQVLTS